MFDYSGLIYLMGLVNYMVNKHLFSFQNVTLHYIYIVILCLIYLDKTVCISQVHWALLKIMCTTVE